MDLDNAIAVLVALGMRVVQARHSRRYMIYDSTGRPVNCALLSASSVVANARYYTKLAKS